MSRPIENLAKEICWTGFHNPPSDGKDSYWRRITERAREDYRRDARLFSLVARRIGRGELDKLLAAIEGDHERRRIDGK